MSSRTGVGDGALVVEAIEPWEVKDLLGATVVSHAFDDAAAATDVVAARSAFGTIRSDDPNAFAG